MTKRFRSIPFGLALVAMMAFAGCTPPVSRPPGGSEPSGGGAGLSRAPGERDVAGGRERGAGTVRQEARAAPSIEALRRGQAPTTPPGSPLKEIYFDFDRYTIRGDARETLKGNAEWLKRNPAVRVTIEGHCDERGTNEYNLALGANRAQAAKDYLVTLGVAAERLSTISYGEEVPVCTEKTEDCWQRNRRDRFVVTSAPPAS